MTATVALPGAPEREGAVSLAAKVFAFVARRRLAGAVVGVGVALASAWGAGHGFSLSARADLDRRTMTSAMLHATVLESEFERLRAIPLVLATEPQIAELLRTKHPAAASRLSARLEALAASLDVAAVYLVDSTGLTRAASNWRQEVSFVGQNYAFRGYFRDAMAQGAAEEFALGTVSGQPGMYFAQRVGDGAGVVVIKTRFDELEKDWAQDNEIAVAVNEAGEVFITTRPDLRFAPLRSVANIGEFLGAGGGVAAAAGSAAPLALSPRDWTVAQAPVRASQWSLYVFAPISPAVAPLAAAGRLVGGSIALALLVLLAFLGSREARKARSIAEAARYRIDLERSVAERTAELQASKDRLSREFEERMRAEEKLKRMQDDLVQANKLAILGQISAGVAHEINQPTAAILSYVKNASEFLARGEYARVAGNLNIIVGLVERIGAITGELRAFARKRGARTQTPVKEVLDSALMLMEARMRGLGVQVERRGACEGVIVCVDRIRLEQVVVNLLQNAIDAVKDRERPRIVVETEATDQTVAIAVVDNGPGVAPEVERELFAPFRSTKTSGLGLGLVISRDIVAEFSGSLAYARAEGGGARFEVRIPRAA